MFGVWTHEAVPMKPVLRYEQEHLEGLTVDASADLSVMLWQRGECSVEFRRR